MDDQNKQDNVVEMTTKEEKKKDLLCMCCRGEFDSQDIIKNKNTGCPSCGSTVKPAFLEDKVTLELTFREWDILLATVEIMASKGPEDSRATIYGILSEIGKQNKDLAPMLEGTSLSEIVAKVVSELKKDLPESQVSKAADSAEVKVDDKVEVKDNVTFIDFGSTTKH